MVRIFFLAAGLSCLGACSWSGPGPGAPSWQAARPSAQGFRFDWQLSGDPAVAPLQVFDDGRETWLQFQPGQPLPAIFGVGADGEHALPYVRRDPYVVVGGAWKGLAFRGGRLTARALRATSLAAVSAQGPQTGAALPAPVATDPTHPRTDLAAAAALAAESPAAAYKDAAVKDAAVNEAASRRAPDAAQASLFRAAPPDATLRAVLARWADAAGWTFQPQHWAVDVDIPLAATAEFSGDFKTAVRGLLGATELADRPLQPCFYGNRVLRVVPLAQSCSRAATPQGAAA
ncbi:TcpQ domain-containing protein [Achromobacter sp. MFA1 R4]|uniref:TcpQ domain-containing protein n=1 Tax=Achromobacter sp. MFA1 R4 TaxID=1881016 RepID=UPI00095371F2|nr:TcpQ domain-containing protein [Achromobacter sp. MFA1 R4]SIT27744.1 Conjugal transfer protein [Achromobacter sp. MFA1 R4]